MEGTIYFLPQRWNSPRFWWKKMNGEDYVVPALTQRPFYSSVRLKLRWHLQLPLEYILVQEEILVVLAEEVRGYVGGAWCWNHGLVVTLENDISSNVAIIQTWTPGQKEGEDILLLKPSVKFLILDPCSSILVAAWRSTMAVVNLVGAFCLKVTVYLIIARIHGSSVFVKGKLMLWTCGDLTGRNVFLMEIILLVLTFLIVIQIPWRNLLSSWWVQLFPAPNMKKPHQRSSLWKPNIRKPCAAPDN